MLLLPFQRRQYIMPQILCALCPFAGNESQLLRDQTQAVPSLMRLAMKSMLVTSAVLLCLSSAVQAAQDPEAVYAKACAACHNGQLPMAPKRGDKAAWEPRVAKGMDTLVQSVTNGLNAMPPRGLCMDCSAEDYQAVIKLMSE